MSRSLPAPEPWTVVAQNLPEHARNRIHTDEGARAAGFRNALVAGVTTYAYLTHPVAVAWGLDWVRRGGAEVRFRAPVHAGDVLTCVPTYEEDAAVVEARVEGRDTALAMLRAWPTAPWADARRVSTAAGADAGDSGSLERLATRRVRLDGEFGATYGSRAGDDLDVYEKAGIVHPAVWPALANHVVHAELARGPWIHIRSRIAHHSIARGGSWATIDSVVVDRFHRSGHRAVVDVVITVDGVVAATLEHEAIVELDERGGA